MTKNTKRASKVPKEDEIYYFTNDEVGLIVEALKRQVKYLGEERFYEHQHPEPFYQIYLERYWKIINQLNRQIPKYIFKKMPKFEQPPSPNVRNKI